MTCYKLVSLCLSSLALIGAPACGDREKTTADSDGSSSSSTADDSTTSGEIPTTSDPTTPTTTGAESGSGGATDGSSSSGDTAVTTTPPPCMDPMEGAPNNTECADASGCGCQSGKCFLVPILGGWCGECLGDDDCAPGGCTVPNPIDGVGSTCNQGEPGADCQSDAVCTDPANLHCGSLLAVENIIDVSTCGECGSNADCADPKKPNCSPTYDVMNFTGKYVCIEDGAVPNASRCNSTTSPARCSAASPWRANHDSHPAHRASHLRRRRRHLVLSSRPPRPPPCRSGRRISAATCSTSSPHLAVSTATTSKTGPIRTCFPGRNWQVGSLSNVSMREVMVATPFIIMGMIILLKNANKLDALVFGEETAQSLGLNLAHFRMNMIIGVGLIIGAITAICGILGFVGLIVPHIIRPFVGNQPSKTLIPSFLFGALFTLAADIVVRILWFENELRLGVILTLLGAPFFFALLLRMKGQGGKI